MGEFTFIFLDADMLCYSHILLLICHTIYLKHSIKSELIANMDKKKVGNKGHTTKTLPYFYILGEQIQVLQNFEYLGTNVPSTNRGNICYESRLHACWNS